MNYSHGSLSESPLKIVSRSLFLILVLLLTGCGHSNYQPEPYYTVKQAPVIARPRPLTIAVDPGHGGKDQGAHKKKPSYEEKELTLATAKIVAQYLKQMGYNTLVTRTDDTFIPLDTRSSMANSQHVDLFLSIHYNAAANAKAYGVEVYYFDDEKDKARGEASKKLATSVLGNIISQTQAKSRGVKHGNLAVIRETKMPAILIEGGFLTNDDELKHIQDPTYRSTLARGIAMGVRDYIRQSGIKGSQN